MAALTLVLALALTLLGCGSVDVGVEGKDNTTPPPGQSAVGAGTTTAPAAGRAETTTTPADGREETTTTPPPPVPDEPCNGRPGQEIAPVDIPAVRSDPVRVPEQKLAGHVVPGFVVPRVYIPAQRVPAQCARIADAPAGCFGAVTILRGTVPATSIPEVTIPGVDVPGAHQDPVRSDAVTHAAVTKEAKTTSRECAQKVRPGEYRPSVYQDPTYRPPVYRPPVYRQPAYRPSVCVGTDCIDAVNVPAVNVPAVNVPAVNVPARNLASRTLPEIKSKCVRVLSDRASTIYDVCADVLFAFNRADIRPAAERVLRQVADSLRERFSDRRIRVDGHTDSTGSPTYNERLSLRRATAVKRWLTDHAHIGADRIGVRGYGEARPVASNADAAGRARNRRVVVGVR